MRGDPRIVELVEYATTSVPAAHVSTDARQRIEACAAFIRCQPTFGDTIELRSEGWVGYLPLGDALALRMRPRVPVASVVHMLVVAYDLGAVEFLDDVHQSEGIDTVFERLATRFAHGVERRARRGLFRTYVGRDERSPVLRGRLDVTRRLRTPWRVSLPYNQRTLTADIEDNRILAWTLYKLTRRRWLRAETRRALTGALRTLASDVSIAPTTAAQCRGRSYHRQNADYAGLHSLSAFFLDNLSPELDDGRAQAPSFVVSMPRLFERYVARSLARELTGSGMRVETQRAMRWAGITFRPDIVVSHGDRAVLVADTKYKTHTSPSASDVEQVIAYAHMLQSPTCALVYPAPGTPLDTDVRGIRLLRGTVDLARGIHASTGLRRLADLARRASEAATDTTIGSAPAVTP